MVQNLKILLIALFEIIGIKMIFSEKSKEYVFPKPITAIFHEGACSTTTEWDGRFMMHNNYEYSKMLLHYALHHQIPFIYASSAAVYGGGQIFKESPEYESPLNVYGYSKFNLIIMCVVYCRRFKVKL